MKRGIRLNAEHFIKRINKIDALIFNKRKQYQRLVDVAEGMSGGFSVGDRVQSSRNLYKSADAVASYVVIEEEISKLFDEKNRILAVLERLPEKEYRVLCAYYIEEQSLKEIAFEFDRSYEWAKKKKHDALLRLQRIIDKLKD